MNIEHHYMITILHTLAESLVADRMPFHDAKARLTEKRRELVLEAKAKA